MGFPWQSYPRIFVNGLEDDVCSVSENKGGRLIVNILGPRNKNQSLSIFPDNVWYIYLHVVPMFLVNVPKHTIHRVFGCFYQTHQTFDRWTNFGSPTDVKFGRQRIPPKKNLDRQFVDVFSAMSCDMGVSKNGGAQQPLVFLLKMIILGCFGHLRKHPFFWKQDVPLKRLVLQSMLGAFSQIQICSCPHCP